MFGWQRCSDRVFLGGFDGVLLPLRILMSTFGTPLKDAVLVGGAAAASLATSSLGVMGLSVVDRIPSALGIRARKKTNKHKHFRRDGLRDKQELCLGQTGPLPGTKWDPSLGQTGLSLFNSTVKSLFCPVCPWDGRGFVPGTIVPQGPSEKCLCVFCLLVFFAPKALEFWFLQVKFLPVLQELTLWRRDQKGWSLGFLKDSQHNPKRILPLHWRGMLCLPFRPKRLHT